MRLKYGLVLATQANAEKLTGSLSAALLMLLLKRGSRSEGPSCQRLVKPRKASPTMSDQPSLSFGKVWTSNIGEVLARRLQLLRQPLGFDVEGDLGLCFNGGGRQVLGSGYVSRVCFAGMFRGMFWGMFRGYVSGMFRGIMSYFTCNFGGMLRGMFQGYVSRVCNPCALLKPGPPKKTQTHLSECAGFNSSLDSLSILRTPDWALHLTPPPPQHKLKRPRFKVSPTFQRGACDCSNAVA